MTTPDDLSRKAETLRSLHHRPGRPLVLVNAWDAATARLVEEAGAEAVATTSAGIAFASGFPDGQKISRDRMLEAVATICRSVSLPVTADVEAGYGDSPEDAGRTAAGVLEAGAVGMNLEDGTGDADSPLLDIERQVAKIRAVVDTARRHGVPIVVNSRTDVYLRGVGAEESRFDEAVRRGKAYRNAGADCIFVPGVHDPRVIGALVAALACPVNVLAVAGSPPIEELARLGVARVSLGSGPMRAAMTWFGRVAEETLTKGTYSGLDGIRSHVSMNELMKRGSRP
jgi:2-methylisocitrate lyase-like PEP mutase family enzyme